MSKNIKQVLPKGDNQIIKDALIQYQKSLDCLIDKFVREGNESMVDQLHHTRFDLHSLIGFMEYDVTINMPQKAKDNFCHLHSVDFPLYVQDKCKLSYPVEEESEWVTIIKGDFSFIDDGEHGRECYVNSIVGIEKHLRYDMGQVIDDIENDGYGYVVVEDYDGSIEMNHPKKDDREFQVVWLATHYDARSEVQHFSHFKDDNGYEDELIDNIDKLELGESTKIVEGVMVIRIF